MIIRPAMPEDYKSIRACVDAAFGTPAEGTLVEALRMSGDVEIELVAEDGGIVAGHVLLSPLTSPQDSLGLSPLTVRPAHQKKGIGSALVRRAISDARGLGWAAVFVFGSPQYYSRFGFSIDDAAKFGTIYPREYMMALALRPRALNTLSGDIEFAPAFAGLG